jgi:HEPN domain-containing protein
MSHISQKWVEQSLYDLETAKAMLKSGRWLYVLFCCQQAVEKMMKGLIVQNTNEHPPRLHNLMRLAERANLVVDESMAERFRLLTAYYIETRYPEELQSMAGQADLSLAEEVLGQTEEALSWLRSRMK